jgi:hypothetical protein
VSVEWLEVVRVEANRVSVGSEDSVALHDDRVRINLTFERGDDFDRLNTAAKRLGESAADESLETTLNVVQ